MTLWTWQWDAWTLVALALGALLAGLVCKVAWDTRRYIHAQRAYIDRCRQRRGRAYEDVAWSFLRGVEADRARELHEQRTGLPAFLEEAI